MTLPDLRQSMVCITVADAHAAKLAIERDRNTADEYHEAQLVKDLEDLADRLDAAIARAKGGNDG